MATFNNTGEMEERELKKRKEEVIAMIARRERIVVAHREIDTRGCKCDIFHYYIIKHEERGSDEMVGFVLSRPDMGEPAIADAGGFVPSTPALLYPPDERDFEMKREDFDDAKECVSLGKFLHVLGIQKGKERWLSLGFYTSGNPLEMPNPEKAAYPWHGITPRQPPSIRPSL